MKLHHKINHGWAPDHTDPVWAERVEVEAEAISTATARAYAKAQERLSNAVAKAKAETQRRKPDRAKVKRLEAAVEARRRELMELEHLMNASPASAQHRGTGSHRAVPSGEVL